MLIRRIEDADVESVVELAQANYDGVMSRHHSTAVLAAFRADVTPDAFREQMTWKQFFIVEDAGQVVATGALADFGTSAEPKHVVSQFYVRSDLHRRGIGTRLLAHLVETAIDVGVDNLHVPSSRNAIPFYEHGGFIVDALQPDAAAEITWMTNSLCEQPAEQAHRAGSQ